MSEAPVRRLSKVAKELNVGIGTIGEFLDSKGYDIDAKPNTKIQNDVYEALLNEFQSEKEVKEESVQQKKNKVVRETVSIDDVDKIDRDDADDSDEIFIKNMGSSAGSNIEQPAPEEPKEEAPAEEEKPAPVEEKPEEPVEDVPAIEEPVAEKNEVAEEPEAKPNEEPEEQPETEEVEVRKAPEGPKIESIERKKDGETGKGPNVLGRIDLGSINARTRPTSRKQKEEAKRKEEAEKAKKKSAEEAQKKAEEVAQTKQQEETQKAEQAAAEQKKKESNEVVKAKSQKLEGPSIVGKIDLPADRRKKKPKPVASSDQSKETEKPKKKRRRISRPVDPASKQQQSGPRVSKGKPSKKVKGKTPRAELSDEDIQKEIKETLARLSGGGGKSKSSKFRREKRQQVAQQKEEELAQQEAEQKVLKVTEFVTVQELANMMDVQVTEIISACMSLGMMVSINQRLDAETLTIVAEEFGYSVEFVDSDIDETEIAEEEEDPAKLLPRPPIVTVMGHVDHGKTSLLDYVRKENVIAGEAGGITQHIGAYNVQLEGDKTITFLDTPGHEAFTAMRARGAQVTDLVIIVIAADDSVMPQTREAINHAQAAGVPMVFAFNKIDKPGANADKIREELSGMDILVEEWGGKFQTQEISAKNGTGIEDLLEKVLLEAELLDIKANPDKLAQGAVIEASLDKGRGYVTNLLVESGTLRVGDMLVAGAHAGKVKAMFNERGQDIQEAGPAAPVSILGFNGAPAAGDKFKSYEDEREAKQIANKREQLLREQGVRTQRHITLDEIGRRLALGDFQELNLIVKGDVDGSVEALSDSMLKQSTENIQVNVIHKSVGQISESDVLLASASDAIIIGFQVRPSSSARKIAEKEEIQIKLYSVIYDAIEEVKDAMQGMLKPKFEEKIVCNIEVRETFKISKVGTIAGCYVLDGKVHRKTDVRLIRDGVVKYSGKLGSLKRFKDDVKEVAAGYECGLNIENFNDIKVGDIIEGFEQVEVEQKL